MTCTEQRLKAAGSGVTRKMVSIVPMTGVVHVMTARGANGSGAEVIVPHRDGETRGTGGGGPSS